MKDIDSLLRSFWYAIKGFLWMVFNERNFRIHLVCLGYMMFFLFRYDFFVLSKVEYAVLVVCAALVIGGEMINSGIEKADDSVSRETVHTIKISKDVAAGAVLVFAIFSVLCGIAIMYQPKAFELLFNYFLDNPLSIVLFAVSVVIFTIFIFFGFGRKKK
jgi:diacylglycerol kinase (ATP)